MSEGLANRERELAELPRPQADQAAMRAELDAVEQALADRGVPQIAAARIEPPSYIVRELGERPADPIKRESWDRGVRKIESYRQEYGVTDKSRAFGTRPQERSARKAAERSLRRIQRELGLKRQLARAHRVEREIGRNRPVKESRAGHPTAKLWHGFAVRWPPVRVPEAILPPFGAGGGGKPARPGDPISDNCLAEETGADELWSQ